MCQLDYQVQSLEQCGNPNENTTNRLFSQYVSTHQANRSYQLHKVIGHIIEFKSSLL